MMPSYQRKQNQCRSLSKFFLFGIFCSIATLIIVALMIYNNPKFGKKIVSFIENKLIDRKHFNNQLNENVKKSVKIETNNSNATITTMEEENKSYKSVYTKSGVLKGSIKSEFGIKIMEFLGIPFAEPPIENLRFKFPEPRRPWKGVRDATNWPALCLQPNLDKVKSAAKMLTSNVSEDCLYLNVWSPAVKKDENLLPVMVFIHGGSFINFGTSFEFYYGGTVAAVGRVVLVTIQYRLGIFGFLDAENDEIPGNLGIFDQAAALMWIKNNIKYFGGDGNSITLFGQSAGAISIGLHMISPISSTLFHRVILQSGSPMVFNRVYESGAIIFDKIKQMASCQQNSSIFLCLQEYPAIQLNNIQEKLAENIFGGFFPTIPNKVLPHFPNVAFDVNEAEEEINQKEVLLGVNKDEGTLFLHLMRPDKFPLDAQPNVSKEEATQILLETFKDFNLTQTQSDQLISVALQNSNNESLDAARSMASFVADLLFTCPVLKLANSLTHWNTSVFTYYFNERSNQSRLHPWFGVSHHDEIPFVFGLPLRFPHLYNGNEVDFSKRIISIWTHFARTGEMKPQSGIEWPQFMEETMLHMELNSAQINIGSKLNEHHCILYDLAYDTLN